MTETHNSSIMNSGTIEAITGPSGHSIAIFVSYSGSLNLTNSGVISGGRAIEAVGFYTEYHDIANLTAGIVRGNILLENSHDILTNDGLIIGDVSLRAWDDIYNGGNGRIVGKLDLGDGDDAAASGLADDLVYGGRGRDSIRGNLGYDILFGGVGDDWIDGGDQSDQLNGEGGADTLLGQAANDTLTGAGQTDLLNGGSGSDILYGGDDNDSLFGDTQRDQIFGDAGDDVIDGGTGDDTVDGGTQRDRAFGGSGFDAMAGAAGNDTLQGGNDADTLSGGGNYDVLEGGDGDDVLDGGDLNDVIFGNAGNDRIIFRKTGDTDTIRDFAAGAGAGDVIRLVGFGAAFDTFAEVLAAATDNGQHTTIDFGGGDVLILRGVLKSQLAADDFVFG
ncbi:MAG: hypothetical protein HXY21_01980 [Parvularculaceae bacterium]|nr:hypothetical protein [Parvularculaceae bacterium]